jgi:hypothetical protein
MEWDSLLITWYSLCFWEVLLYWEINFCAYWGCFIFVFLMVCKFLEPNRHFFTLTVQSDVCECPVWSRLLYWSHTMSQCCLSVLNALISLLDLVSQGKCSCDAAGDTELHWCTSQDRQWTAAYACQPRSGKISCTHFCTYKLSNAISMWFSDMQVRHHTGTLCV